MKHFINFLVFFMVSLTASAQVVDQEKIAKLDSIVFDFIEQKGLANASYSLYAVDAKSGKTLIDVNPGISLIPASNMKVISTATCMELYGAEHRFLTTVWHDGFIDSAGVLHGNIFIRGGGDPVLGSKEFYNNYYEPYFLDKWTQAIAEAGIRSIKGRIIASDKLFEGEPVPDTWTWGDMGNYFGAGASGLSAFDNTYTLTFKSENIDGGSTEITKISPDSTGITIYNYVKASNAKGDNTIIYGAPDSYERSVRGTIPKGSQSFSVKGSMPNPGLYLASLYRNQIIASGIAVSYPATTTKYIKENDTVLLSEKKLLISTLSPELKEIARVTNTNSVNLYAEHLFKHAELKLKEQKKNPKLPSSIKEFWEQKGIDVNGMYVEDGSGLSRSNGLTTKQLVEVLNYMKYQSNNSQSYVGSMAIAGRTGTFKTFCSGTICENNLAGKSGTIDRVKSYSGYLKSQSGREITFSIIVNNYTGSTTELKKKIESVAVALAEL